MSCEHIGLIRIPEDEELRSVVPEPLQRLLCAAGVVNDMLAHKGSNVLLDSSSALLEEREQYSWSGGRQMLLATGLGPPETLLRLAGLLRSSPFEDRYLLSLSRALRFRRQECSDRNGPVVLFLLPFFLVSLVHSGQIELEEAEFAHDVEEVPLHEIPEALAIRQV